MRAMRAEQFSGYEGLKLVDLPKPAVTDGKVLVTTPWSLTSPPSAWQRSSRLGISTRNGARRLPVDGEVKAQWNQRRERPSRRSS
jgi:NADPH:quinone reductase-like Zn-dependent oxidoreductase